MNFQTDHPLQPFWNLAAAPLQAQALEQALEHRLFVRLPAPATAQAISEALGMHPGATQVWLDLLWTMGLLARHAPAGRDAPAEYAASALAARFFAEGAPQDCAQSWRHRNRMLSGFASQWHTLLRQGHVRDAGVDSASAPRGSWAQAAREQIGQEQRAITVPAVLRILDSLPMLPQQGRFLDLGGGPGHVGIALARRLPDWQGAVCDQLETVEVARQNIRAADLAQRVQALACDLNHQQLDGAYDLIWCSSVLHFLDEPMALMDTVFQALNPGGLVLMAHAELSDDAAVAAEVMPFYGNVMLRGNYLPRPGEVPQAMARAGLRDVKALGRVAFPMAPVWLYAGSRPVGPAQAA